MQSFGDYHDLYLETDVLLLADVFMNYTIMCLQDDGLDPSHYVSAPGMFNAGACGRFTGGPQSAERSAAE